MSTATSVSSLIGGAIVFVAAVAGLARAIFRQVSATDKNTDAVRQLTSAVDNLDKRTDTHESRISTLEGRERRP